MTRSKITDIERTNSADKVDQILQGAMQEFLVHGYAGTSMDKVASAAGVSKATVYSYFQDKKSLFESLIQQIAEQKCQAVFGSLPSEGDPYMLLRQLMVNGLDRMMQDDEHRAFMRVLIGESGRFPELAQAWVQYVMKPSLPILCKFLEHPDLKISDPEATAQVIVGSLVHFMMTQEMLHGKDIFPMDGDRIINALFDLICKNREESA
ncbi:TetR/AcrR family transcriptional regulator [Calothrix sp. 336/3]|uniref:TetR/AcrR family transcriptional regulator n=1 Tax=Calothrix sp. 336/3 TaxID=1337936 RepID=UPI0004E3FE2C|nr:TetR/AcrR family transcriptional regulator [Calothrix sp. 336/3]AKG24849.1 TetR family transcriptional regulator [Calothrix sp. 336/3]